MVSCSSESGSTVPISASDAKHLSFTKKRGYVKSTKIYQNIDLLRQSNRNNTKIYVSMKNQRIQIFVDNMCAIDAPCTTGKTTRPTPRGAFRVREKIVNKRSTIYGAYYYKGQKVFAGDRRRYRGPRDRYVGAELPYWMRLTSDGIGLHASKGIERFPDSNGCIRLPHDIAFTIFNSMSMGTRVIIAD